MANPQDTDLTLARLRTVLEGRVEGDLFVGGQKGGIAGGHKNVNVLREGKESIKSRIEKIQGVAPPDVVITLRECLYSLGQLEGIKTELRVHKKDVEKLQKFFADKEKELQASNSNHTE